MSLLDPRMPGFGAVAFPHDASDEGAWQASDGWSGTTPHWLGMPWYQTASGLTINYETALRVSCIFHGARLYAETIGSLPIRVLRDLGGNRKQEVTDHRLVRLLKRQPNAWQTAQQFQETMTAWALLWGTAIAEIRPGPSGPYEELWPIEPAWVTAEQVRTTKRLRFVIDEPGEPTRTLVQDEVFRVEGFGLHRFLGESILKLAREAIGLWLSHEKFQGLYFGQGARPSVWLQVPEKLDADAYLRMKTSAKERYEGWHSHHKVALLEQGTTVKETGYTAKDSQMTEAKRELVEEMARFLNLPVQFFMMADEPTHSSAEVFNQQAVTYSFQPWATRWEQSIGRDLMLETEQDLYIKFIFDALLRGKTLERAQAYAQFIMNGVMSENECRIREDLDPVDGLDEPRRSANQDRGQDPAFAASAVPAVALAPGRRDKGAAELPSRQLALLAQASAARVVRRELAALRDKGAKLAADPAAWAVWLEEFYRDHQAVVAEALQLRPLDSRAYAAHHVEALRAGGLAAAERWETEAVEELVAMAVAA